MTIDYLVSFPGLGIRDLPVSRVAFHLFGFSIYWYGLMIALAVVVVMLLAFREAKKFDLTSDHVVDTMMLIVPLMIIFARLYYVVFEWPVYQSNWLKIFDTRDGGLAFYGGVIGGLLALLIFSKWRRKPLGQVIDFFVVYVPLGQAIGRWGNFFNQEAFGSNTALPWGMISNGTTGYLSAAHLPGVNPMKPVHPTFFYEFVANLIIFAILHRIRRQSRRSYETMAWYLVLYGAVRFFVESIRTDALYVPGTGLRVSMLVSALMTVGGLIFLALLWRHDRRLAALGLDLNADPGVDGTPDGGEVETEAEAAGEPEAAAETAAVTAADETAGTEADAETCAGGEVETEAEAAGEPEAAAETTAVTAADESAPRPTEGTGA